MKTTTTTKQRLIGRVPNAQKLRLGVLLGCLLLPAALLALAKSNPHHQLAILSLQFSILPTRLSTVEERSISKQPGANLTSLSLPMKAIQEQTDSVANQTTLSLPLKGTKESSTDSVANLASPSLPPKGSQEHSDSVAIDTQVVNSSTPSQEQPLALKLKENNITFDETNASLTQAIYGKQAPSRTSEQVYQVSGNSTVPESKLICDRSEPRSDTCSMLGDVRVLGKSSTILLASPSPWENSTLEIRPYARKWETAVMETIKKISLKPAPDAEHVPACSVNHSVPAVVFSTGGFLGNVFHDFTDVLVPLFATSHRYRGEVQFLATDFNAGWIDRYRHILKRLSRYRIINMDADDQVRCFPEARVGLESHKVFGIDPSRTPNGYSMLDFKQMLRDAYSLNKVSTKKIVKQSKKKPRLLMILRKGSRSLTNAKAVIRMARAAGYKVVAAAPEDMRDLSRFARIVNSCDVMVGVHGAGLANMVFLPTNASVVQIIPWGGLKWACRHDFGEPAPEMGLNYVEYEIKEEESSLIEEYPRDHAVFTDPESIQKQGWNMLWSIFLNKQKVRLDVGRFREVLLEIYQTLKQ
ncbi:uncharacterized protein M6B38_287495 [Iris pallida]|uniref:Glycosyltransferase 61 catalytic domain-containing protein n=1 Tax=Iris pallida TaxID=29817 RepID=A0AAX6HXN0_IRIPA|nr:uncharacterized protein M6B38_287495 [Iris pallida]